MAMAHHVNESTSQIAAALANRKPARVEASFTRPADTTAYTAKDAIFPPVPAEGEQIKALTFADAVPMAGDSSLILNAQLYHYAAETTRLDAWLYLFSAPLLSAPVDHTLFDPAEAEKDTLLSAIRFAQDLATDLGSRFSLYEVVPNAVIQTASDSRHLYGVLVAGNAYVPLASEKFRIVLGMLPRDLSIY